MSGATSEQDLDRFFAVSPELLCVFSEAGWFLRWNAAWESTLGHGAEEMARLRFLDLVHPDDVAGTRAQLDRLGAEATMPAGGGPLRLRLENRFRTRSGLHVRLAWSLLTVVGGGRIYGSARNVDKQRRVERALMQRIESKMQVASISSHFIDAQPEDLDRGIDEALARMGALLQADRCCLLLSPEDGSSRPSTRSWAAEGVPPEACEAGADEAPLSWLMGRLAAGEPVAVTQLSNLPAEGAEARALYERSGVQSILRVPAAYAGRMVGALGLDAVHGPRSFGEGARTLLSAVGETLAMTLERARAEESLRRVVEQQASMREVIEQQEVAIQTLSTPIMQVWDGVLALPIVGGIDARRAADIMEKLLGRIVDTQSRHAILELTGVEEVDAATAQHLFKMLRSIELLGAQGVIAGVRPGVAQALASLDGGLSPLVVQRDLQHALRYCMSRADRGGKIARRQ
ncbi:MAG: GAF domain-containing protein [Polyangiaceae bacterium]|nr:GAF domain-containing protein [Polyangiaceae bacterium]